MARFAKTTLQEFHRIFDSQFSRESKVEGCFAEEAEMTFWIFVVSLFFLLVALRVLGLSGIFGGSDRFTAPIRIGQGTSPDGSRRTAAFFEPKFERGKVVWQRGALSPQTCWMGSIFVLVRVRRPSRRQEHTNVV